MATRLPRTIEWFPLTDAAGRLSSELRAALDGRSGVYVIRRRGTRRASYVGMSETGRLWRTLIRHFHGCGTFAFANSRDGEKTEWCKDRGRRGYVIAYFVTDKASARGLEARAIKRYVPSWNLRQEAKAFVKEHGETPF